MRVVLFRVINNDKSFLKIFMNSIKFAILRCQTFNAENFFNIINWFLLLLFVKLIYIKIYHMIMPEGMGVVVVLGSREKSERGRQRGRENHKKNKQFFS